MDLTLIIPCHNEAENINPFLQRTCTCLEDAPEAPRTLELVFIDDGSSDSTFAKIVGAMESPPCPQVTIKAIELSRNFGKEAAMLAGLKHASGDMVGFIDADMQQDPAISLEMYGYLKDHPETDCVAAVQEERRESRALAWFKHRFYKTFNAVGDVELPANASDFRVFRRNVAEALMAMPEYFRFSKGLFAWVGFRTHTIPYTPKDRHAGKTSWSFRSLMGYALGGIVSFTTWPLRLILYVGMFTSLISIIYLLVVVLEYFVVGISVPGYPTLICITLLFAGIVMLALGIFGEYLGRIYIEGKRRPPYIARRVLCQDAGFPGPSAGQSATASKGAAATMPAFKETFPTGQGHEL